MLNNPHHGFEYETVAPRIHSPVSEIFREVRDDNTIRSIGSVGKQNGASVKLAIKLVYLILFISMPWLLYCVLNAVDFTQYRGVFNILAAGGNRGRTIDILLFLIWNILVGVRLGIDSGKPGMSWILFYMLPIIVVTCLSAWQLRIATSKWPTPLDRTDISLGWTIIQTCFFILTGFLFGAIYRFDAGNNTTSINSQK